MDDRKKYEDWLKSDSGKNRQNEFATWQAAKESSSKELEAAKQRAQEAEAAETIAYHWNSQLKAEKEALEKRLATAESQLVKLGVVVMESTPRIKCSGVNDSGCFNGRETTNDTASIPAACTRCGGSGYLNNQTYSAEELTKLLAAARKEGFEEGGKAELEKVNMLRESLTWVSEVNACDYEYQKVARIALAATAPAESDIDQATRYR